MAKKPIQQDRRGTRGLTKTIEPCVPLPLGLSSAARRKLLDWFDANARSLPWRTSRDPYRIWVSEVMLQQTTVATVASRFERFIAKFPNVTALAAADEQDVLKQWQGLGYYNRARNLHRAARILAERFPSQLPDEPDVWSELPGIGRYILGAILSQAFDRRLPIVEANTKRVLSRLFVQVGDLKSPTVQAWLWKAATDILPRQRVGDFNQAMMELGALICTVEKPNCPKCPLRNECLARRQQLQHEIPHRNSRPATVPVREVCIVPRHRGRVLLLRLPESGRWANMWEFPRITFEDSETPESAANRLLESLSLKGKLGSELQVICYVVTRYRITMICLEAAIRAKFFKTSYYVEGRWMLPGELNLFPVSTPQRKLAEIVSKPVQRGLF